MPFFKYNNINLYYEIAGDGPPLLLINGIGCDTRLLELIISSLKSSFTVISYDMRCAGRSDKPKFPFTISQLADEAHSFIKYLGHNTVYLLGFSMGGMIAMDMSLRYPDVIEKLFLVATAPSMKKGPHPATNEVMTMMRRTDVSPELLSQVYDFIFGPDYKKKVPASEFIKFRMEDVNPQPAFAYLNQLEACESFDLTNQISKISTPSYIIVGDQDKLIPPKNSYWLKDHIKNSKLFVFKGVGHMVPLEIPDKLAEVPIFSIANRLNNR